jgi:protein TonB
VTKGLLVRKTTPIYPAIAKATHQQGTVVLAATIGDDGLIHDLEVLASPSPILRAAALDAVKRWQYKPYLLNGKPVEVETVVNVEFRLSN